MTIYHQPVLLEEVLSLLIHGDRSGWIVDCTLGGGGHSAALLEAAPEGISVLGLDRDPDAIESASARLSGYGDRVRIEQGRFGDVAEIVACVGAEPVVGMLFDLGVSSAQLDRASRGFSFRADGPLDMDMERGGGSRALRLLEGLAWRDLAKILGDFGEVPRAGAVARSIARAVEAGQIQTTLDLASLVEREFPWMRKGGRHPATQVFQAIRIAVNGEALELERALEGIPDTLSEGGVAVMISYHSGEDRMVKHGFRGFVKAGGFELPFRRPVSATENEIAANPRARSAKLRAVRRCAGEDIHA